MKKILITIEKISNKANDSENSCPQSLQGLCKGWRTAKRERSEYIFHFYKTRVLSGCGGNNKHLAATNEHVPHKHFSA